MTMTIETPIPRPEFRDYLIQDGLLARYIAEALGLFHLFTRPIALPWVPEEAGVSFRASTLAGARFHATGGGRGAGVAR